MLRILATLLLISLWGLSCKTGTHPLFRTSLIDFKGGTFESVTMVAWNFCNF